MKVASVVGARPNFVKLAPVSHELRKTADEIIVHTGQHYDYLMDKIFFDELAIPAPDYHLGVGSGPHGLQTGEMLRGIEEVLMEERPDAVVVFGDTNTTLAGALAAVKLHIPVAHVEAGLRSFDRRMPEEINRVLVDHCSDLLFCPTETAVRHLANEGITKGVHLTGDVMVEATHECLAIARRQSRILETLGLAPEAYLLATIHRAENTDDPDKLKTIAEAFGRIAEDERLVFPCHPRTRGRLESAGLLQPMIDLGVVLVEPVGYLDMLLLEANAKRILTDSGGVQKEAYLVGVPCVTLRDSTEWVETVEAGWNILTSIDLKSIITLAFNFIPLQKARINVFGTMNAAEKIVKTIVAGKNFTIDEVTK